MMCVFIRFRKLGAGEIRDTFNSQCGYLVNDSIRILAEYMHGAVLLDIRKSNGELLIA